MPKAGSNHSRSTDDALDDAPPVYSDGDAVPAMVIELSMLVEDMLIFI